MKINHFTAIKPNLLVYIKIIAFILLAGTFIKACIDVDIVYDTWWYHLPWAAHLWGIVSQEMYQLSDSMEIRFNGFPILGEYLQGFLWKIFGRVQGANFLSFGSFLIYILFLNKYFSIPWYLSVIAFLTVPLIQIHSTSCMVDLPANIGVSMVVMMAYRSFISQQVLTKYDFVVIFVAAAMAANMKHQTVIILFLVLTLIIIRTAWIYVSQKNYTDFNHIHIIKVIAITLVALCLIFFTQVKNLVVYHNPFYPASSELSRKILNTVFQHKTEIVERRDTNEIIEKSDDHLEKTFFPNKWVESVLEIKKAPWSIDQWSSNPEIKRMGGLFGPYVIFQILLLGYCVYKWQGKDAIIAGILMITLSFITACMPFAYAMRFYLYWIISLISMNLYIVRKFSLKSKFIKPEKIAVLSCIFLLFVLVETKASFVRPRFYTIDTVKKVYVKFKILQKLHPGADFCIVKQQAVHFPYASYFNPQIGGVYTIKDAQDVQECKPTQKVLS